MWPSFEGGLSLGSWPVVVVCIHWWHLRRLNPYRSSDTSLIPKTWLDINFHTKVSQDDLVCGPDVSVFAELLQWLNFMDSDLGWWESVVRTNAKMNLWYQSRIITLVEIEEEWDAIILTQNLLILVYMQNQIEIHQFFLKILCRNEFATGQTNRWY